MSASRIVDAVLLAGGKLRERDPLRALTPDGRKAFVPVAGRPMIAWVLDALDETRELRHVIVVGATADEVGTVRRKPRTFLPDAGDIVASVHAAALHARATEPPATHVLVVSADIPAVTAEALDWHVAATRDRDRDAFLFPIPREVMETRFPDAGRTYARVDGRWFTSGDVCLFALSLLDRMHPAWSRLVGARKSFAAQLRVVGVDLALRWLLGRLTFDALAQRTRLRAGIDGEAVECPYAEAGMDVDAPAHLERLARELGAPPAPAVRRPPP